MRDYRAKTTANQEEQKSYLIFLKKQNKKKHLNNFRAFWNYVLWIHHYSFTVSAEPYNKHFAQSTGSYKSTFYILLHIS